MQSHTGAAFGAQVLRYSSVRWVALALGQATGLASAIVVVHFLGPTEYGHVALLLFFAAAITFVVGLGSRPGTLQLVFGSSDDGEEEEEEEEEEERKGARADSTRRLLGTGIALTAVIGIALTGASLLFAGPVGVGLLGDEGQSALVVWAVAAGGAGAVYELASIAVWMERRPALFLRLSAMQPVLIVAGVIPLVVAGAGVEGVIAGTAIGSAAAAAVALLALRGSYEPVLDRSKAVTIVRRGFARLPVLGSFFVIDYLSLFLLSRFVSDAELGVYFLASRFAMGIAFIAASFQLSLRTLMRTTFSAAMHAEYGAPVAGGALLSYFALIAIGLLLGAALVAHALVGLAPPSYAGAATLVPVLAAAQMTPIAFRVLHRSVAYPAKRRVFVTAVVTAAIVFVGTAVVLIPRLGVEGAPIAILVAFVGPAVYILQRSQRGRRPLVIPYRSLAVAAVAAVACGAGYHAVPASGPSMQIVAAILFLALWVIFVLAAGVVPHAHRGGLLEIARGAVGGDAQAFDVERALRGLEPRDRTALRMAIVERRPLEELAPLLGGSRADASERLVGVLRRAASHDGRAAGDATAEDGRIGRYLFSAGPAASRDADARRLLRAGLAEARDLHDLEAVVASLARARVGLWSDDWAAVPLAHHRLSP